MQQHPATSTACTWAYLENAVVSVQRGACAQTSAACCSCYRNSATTGREAHLKLVCEGARRGWYSGRKELLRWGWSVLCDRRSWPLPLLSCSAGTISHLEGPVRFVQICVAHMLKQQMPVSLSECSHCSQLFPLRSSKNCKHPAWSTEFAPHPSAYPGLCLTSRKPSLDSHLSVSPRHLGTLCFYIVQPCGAMAVSDAQNGRIRCGGHAGRRHLGAVWPGGSRQAESGVSWPSHSLLKINWRLTLSIV